MVDLFDKNIDFNDDVYRNIVSLKISEDLFDDLVDTKENIKDYCSIAIDAEARVKMDIPHGIIGRGFHYYTAIGYPFETQPYLSTRFGNGLYGVWYGSLELKTTIYETVYHMLRTELAIENLKEKIYRERAVYTVHTQAILIDLRGKERSFPNLIADDYADTHAIGEKIHKEGHAGLLVPSARITGSNIVVFNPNILSAPKLISYFNYILDPAKKTVKVQDSKGKCLYEIEHPIMSLSVADYA